MSPCTSRPPPAAGHFPGHIETMLRSYLLIKCSWWTRKGWDKQATFVSHPASPKQFGKGGKNWRHVLSLHWMSRNVWHEGLSFDRPMYDEILHGLCKFIRWWRSKRHSFMIKSSSQSATRPGSAGWRKSGLPYKRKVINKYSSDLPTRCLAPMLSAMNWLTAQEPDPMMYSETSIAAYISATTISCILRRLKKWSCKASV